MQYFVIIMHKANTIIYLVANLGSLYNNSENFLPLSELCNWFNWVKLFLENRPAVAAAIMMPSVSPCPSILVSGAKLESQSHPSPASHVAFKICERVITFSTSLLYRQKLCNPCLAFLSPACCTKVRLSMGLAWV